MFRPAGCKCSQAFLKQYRKWIKLLLNGCTQIRRHLYTAVLLCADYLCSDFREWNALYKGLAENNRRKASLVQVIGWHPTMNKSFTVPIIAKKIDPYIFHQA